jgi:hypothetical protein
MGRRELPPTWTIDTNKVGVAEVTGSLRPVALESRPKVATRKPAKDSGATCLSALTLKRVKNLFD